MRGGVRASLLLVLAVVVMAPTWAPAAFAAASRVKARAALVVDANTGEVLFERNPDEALPPASTTKVLTAIVAIESGRLGDSVRVSEFAASTAPSKIGLRPGQRMVIQDLLYAVLLKSANDASVVVAEGVSGSQAAFSSRMNARARALGATRSNFANPHGLTAPGHVSTVRDLTRIFRHGLTIPLFRSILATPAADLPVDATKRFTIAVRSHNRLLSGWSYQVIGKTGYTRPAKRCFVGAARNGEREIVIALLGSTDLWGDARALVEIGLGPGGPPEPETPVLQAKKPARPAQVRAAPGPKKPVPQLAVRRKAPAEDEGDIEELPRHLAGPARFTVQLGPFGSRNGALDARTKLAKRGYHARVVGKALQVGAFADKGRATRLATNLKRSGYRPVVVALR
ncbi:MAG: D-alanyl-D-alanine carboxypeptidase [bacterium]|nr:D-alanyl-D-alanine carboxypeptidase [bacterium]